MSASGNTRSTPSNMNLDLSDVESDDFETLASRVETFYKSDSAVKAQLAWHWERNHLMLDGKQWLVYEGNMATGGQWRPLKVSKDNEYIPRPVTNYIYDIYQTLKSYLIKNKPRSEVFPNTDSRKDKVGAKLATMCLEANWARLKEQNNYEYAAATLLTYGTVFKKSYWDTTTLNKVRVPRMQMQQTPAGPMQVAAIDPATGDQLYDELPIGDVNTDIIEPYRMALDPLAMDLHKARWIMEYTIQPMAYVKEMYGKAEHGYTGLATELTEEKSLSQSMQRFYNLKNSSGTKSQIAGFSDSGGGNDQTLPNSVVVKEYYERPSQMFPNGRMIVVASGKTLYAGDSPYSGTELGDWHPYSECRWELVPGRFWGKSPLDEATEIQKQINSIDSLIILVRKTMAVPQKLIPIGVGITPGSWTGRPAQEIFYKDMGTGAKPETVPGVGLDTQVLAERAQRVSDLKEITGAIDILKGDRPPGVNAASALSLLYEVGTGKLFPALDRWKGFVELDQKKQLKLVQKFYKEPRQEFIQMLRARNSELSEQEISQFIGTDLYDNCNVIVEAGSNVPKLQAAHQARLMEVAQTGALNLQVPGNRVQYLQDLGISGYDADIGPDTKRAEWENSMIDNLMNSPDNHPVVLDCDDHQVHIGIHNNRMKQPSFMALPAQVQQAYMQHVQQHEQMEQQKQQAMAMQAMAMGQPPQPQQSGTQPQQLHPAGKGPTAQTKNAIAAPDLMNAATIGGARQ